MIRYLRNLPAISYWVGYLIIVWFIASPFSFFDKTFIKGGDIDSLHLPAVAYLSENLHDYRFPFWTEKLYSGFPIYADGEMGYFSPLRLLLNFVISDFLLAIKFEFFILYIFGSIYLYLFLKKNRNYSFIQSALAHIIIFFSSPISARLLHINIIYTYYLLPVGLYFLASYLNTSKIRYIFYRALVFALAFSYGNYHAIAICLIIEGLFLFVEFSAPIISKLKYLLNTLVYTSILILPMLVPSFLAFKNSVRSENLNFLEGSYSAISLVNLAYPLLFGIPGNYIGDKINSTWYSHESLIYIGVTTFIISTLVYLNKAFKDFKLILISLYIFIILATLKYFPINFILDFPPINLFRYWGRSSIIFLFVIGITAPKFFDKSNKFDFELKRLLYLIPILAYLILIYLNSDSNYQINIFLKTIKNLAQSHNYLFLIWAVILSSCILTLALYVRFNKNLYLFTLYGLIIFDILFFTKLVFTSNTYDYSNFKNQEIYSISNNFQSSRVVYFDKNVMGNKPLLYPSWGVHGYLSSYEESLYKNFYSNRNISIRRLKTIDEFNLNQDFFKSVGVVALITESNSTSIKNTDSIFLISSTDISYLLKEEGHILANIYSDTNKQIDSSIKINENMLFKVNGTYISPETKYTSPFYSLNISKGINEIEISYFPKDFYIALFSSIFLLGLVLYINKNNF